MPDEDRWQVPLGRRAALSAHSTRVRNDGRADGILYYPGSGTDILHALFATGSKTRYFIFVDPANLDQAMTNSIREKHSRLNTAQARTTLTNLNIHSQPAGTWMFSMQGATRFLFHFRMGHDAFLAANRGFLCDTVFEKDFWETPDDVDVGDVLRVLRLGGHYSTNASVGSLVVPLSLVGLDFVNSYQFNGDQYLFRRRTVSVRTWANVKAAINASQKVMADLMNEDGALAFDYIDGATRLQIADQLIGQRNAILAPFQQRGIVVPLPLQNPLCRQIARKALGAIFQWNWECSIGVDIAFHMD